MEVVQKSYKVNYVIFDIVGLRPSLFKIQIRSGYLYIPLTNTSNIVNVKII